MLMLLVLLLRDQRWKCSVLEVFSVGSIQRWKCL
jgi:hypothetical protein